MAKAYRATPFRGPHTIDVGEGAGLPILKTRTRKAVQRLAFYVEKFNDDFIFEIAAEVGLDECLSYGEKEGQMVFDLTSLQAVALCSALAACWEIRGA